jgi:hypothetical protein
MTVVAIPSFQLAAGGGSAGHLETVHIVGSTLVPIAVVASHGKFGVNPLTFSKDRKTFELDIDRETADGHNREVPFEIFTKETPSRAFLARFRVGDVDTGTTVRIDGVSLQDL